MSGRRLYRYVSHGATFFTHVTDVVCLNAGVVGGGPLETLTTEDWAWGLIASPQAGPYRASKHSVVAMAGTSFRELHAEGSKVGVSCSCPGLVATLFPSGDRNRPQALQNPAAADMPDAQRQQLRDAIDAIFQRGVSAEHVAECVLDAVKAKCFWLYPDEVYREAIRSRQRAIESGEDPPTHFGALEGLPSPDLLV